MNFFDFSATVALLFGLELVLGIDNVIVIAILVSKLPPAMRRKARYIGLSLAIIMRLIAIMVILSFAEMTDPIISIFSIRDLILISGGLFLLYKAVVEIHRVVEMKEEPLSDIAVAKNYRNAIVQIVILDLVFSVDSVITGIGLISGHQGITFFWSYFTIATAVVLSFTVVLFYANAVGEYILHHPSLKIIALAFLVTIGITLCLEAFHQHIPKAYIYLPMGFALIVEMLQMRHNRNLHRKSEQKHLMPNTDD